MEPKEINQKLMEYLYDEMTASERKEFEKKLAEDAELKKELQELREMREELGTLQDKEVMEPFSIREYPQSIWFGGSGSGKAIWLRPITAIAASLVILMLVGYATDFSISVSKEGMLLGFAGHPSNTEQYLTEGDVTEMLAEALSKNREDIQNSIAQSASTLDSRYDSLKTAFVESQNRNSQVIGRDDLNKFLVNMEQRNAELLEDYLNQSSSQQQEYFKSMLTQFNDYIQEQRAEDLNMIQTDILELEYKQNRQKIVTDEVLAGLLSTVGQNRN
jgi:hypothetical protein